jgi:hypothetical protein
MRLPFPCDRSCLKQVLGPSLLIHLELQPVDITDKNEVEQKLLDQEKVYVRLYLNVALFRVFTSCASLPSL